MIVGRLAAVLGSSPPNCCGCRRGAIAADERGGFDRLIPDV